jgi:hypothetical protein
MERIKQNYQTKCNIKSDINEHLPTLMELSKECETICEFGVRSIVSTWAFLYGLLQNNSLNKNLICVDIKNVNCNNVISVAKEAGINMKFICEDSVKVQIPETDILFIDTWHIYGHLKRELNSHHSKVKKYIIMHDTELDKIKGESIRSGWNIKKQSKDSGYPPEEIAEGLQKAIDEFLENHSEWSVFKIYTNNNGLTILKRK